MAAPAVSQTIEIKVAIPDRAHSVLLVAFSHWNASGFVQQDDELIAYLPADEWTDEREASLREWMADNDFVGDVQISVSPDTNWNEAWERSIQPIRAGDFLVKPTWTDVPPEHADATVIEIDPKMSFGTGHHATTRLALSLLNDAVHNGDRVLDAGTGTGILSIAACRRGASEVIAFDVDPNAIENAEDNLAHNAVTAPVDVRRGTIDVVPERGFDAILANITRNVLLDWMPLFAEKLAPGGRLILAGIFEEDRDSMLTAAAEHNLTLVRERAENNWWAALLELEGIG